MTSRSEMSDFILAGGNAPAFHLKSAELEDRAGVDSMEKLQDARRGLLEHLAPLKALHGHNGLFDDKRKGLLEALKVKARLKITQDGGKATEGAVDALAYADQQYEDYLDQGVDDRINYIRLQNEVDEIAERVRSREIELLCYNAEAKLAR